MKKIFHELTADFFFILDYHRLTTNNRRGLAALGEVQGVARAYPCLQQSPPPGDVPRTKSDRHRHRRINHNSVSSINSSLSSFFDANFSRRV